MITKSNYSISLSEELELWESISPENYKEFCNKFFDLTKTKTRSVIGLGAGRMGYALQGFIMRLNHIGFRTAMIGDTCVPKIKQNDIVIVNTSSGETPTILLYIKQAKQFGAIVFTITTSPDSTAALMSDAYLIYGKDFKSKQPMKSAFEQFTWALFDQMVYDFLTSDEKSVELDSGVYSYDGIIINTNHSILE